MTKLQDAEAARPSIRGTLAQLFGLAETKSRIPALHQFAIILALGLISWLPLVTVLSWMN